MLSSLQNHDEALFRSVNGLAGRSEAVDAFANLVASNHLFKGVVVMMVFWCLWFALPHAREKLAAVLIVAVAAIFAGRSLAILMPFRTRPMHDSDLTYVLPFGLPPTTLDGWSSMPSDHAVMYFALAAGVGLISKWLGAILALHALLVVSLPRVFLGFHYPSDILAGALVGAAIGLALTPWLTRAFERRHTLDVADRFPQFFYPLAFLVTMLTASMFEMIRIAGGEIVRVVQLL